MSQFIRCVVFSFDRAMQLRALLDSMRIYVGARYTSVVVLYRTSSRRFAAGYDIVRLEHPEVEWLAQREFRADLLSLVGRRGLLVFHTDDDVFFGEINDFDYLRDDEVCFSLRLGLNIRLSYSHDIPERLSLPRVQANRLSWDWRTQGRGSFSYPLALNGHIVRASDARGCIEAVQFSDPNELESELHALRNAMRPRMASPLDSRVVSVPANVVTRTFRNRHGGQHDTYELNERLLAGERIAPELMTFSAVYSCHAEIPFAFRASATTNRGL